MGSPGLGRCGTKSGFKTMDSFNGLGPVEQTDRFLGPDPALAPETVSSPVTDRLLAGAQWNEKCGFALAPDPQS
jgi:hypothetical protein